MFTKVTIVKIAILLYLVTLGSTSPIFFGHPKHTTIYISQRKDTGSANANLIPTTMIKPQSTITVKLPIPVPVQGRDANTFSSDVHKFPNEMKKIQQIVSVKMNGNAMANPKPTKPTTNSPFNLFNNPDSEHIVVHVPYNVHTHNIHHHHIQTVPVYKHVPVIKHVPVHVHVPVVKEVAIPVHLPAYRDGWSNQVPWW